MSTTIQTLLKDMRTVQEDQIIIMEDLNQVRELIAHIGQLLHDVNHRLDKLEGKETMIQ